MLNNRQNTGHRGELYSSKLKNTSGTSFFFNLKENREGDIYLNIVESYSQQKKQDEGTKPHFERHSILIFAEQRDAFARACLAALEALGKGESFQSHIESPQREFDLQINKKRGNLHLVLREQSQHYDRLLQEQIQIPQNSASYFSKALIEIIEQWLLHESKRKAPKRRPLNSKGTASEPKRKKKKVVALKTENRV